MHLSHHWILYIVAIADGFIYLAPTPCEQEQANIYVEQQQIYMDSCLNPSKLRIVSNALSTEILLPLNKRIRRFDLHGYPGIFGAFRITHQIIFFMYGTTRTPLLVLKHLFPPRSVDFKYSVAFKIFLSGKHRLLHNVYFHRPRLRETYIF